MFSQTEHLMQRLLCNDPKQLGTGVPYLSSEPSPASLLLAISDPSRAYGQADMAVTMQLLQLQLLCGQPNLLEALLALNQLTNAHGVNAEKVL